MYCSSVLGTQTLTGFDVITQLIHEMQNYVNDILFMIMTLLCELQITIVWLKSSRPSSATWASQLRPAWLLHLCRARPPRMFWSPDDFNEQGSFLRHLKFAGGREKNISALLLLLRIIHSILIINDIQCKVAFYQYLLHVDSFNYFENISSHALVSF